MPILRIEIMESDVYKQFMKNRWFYRYAGQTLSSALELPEWAAFSVAPAAPTLRFELNAPAPLSADEPVQIERSICRFVVPEVALYQVSAGQTVSVTPAPDAQQREIRLFLLGSAWGIAQYQRGEFALHAGVVGVGANGVGANGVGDESSHGAGCLAFCGASGAGKSSSVAWLVAQGYQLWSDDLSVCQFDQGAPAVWPSTRRLKLWRESLDALGRATDDLVRDHFRQEKFHWELETPRSLAQAAPLPLRAIYLLEWGEPECVRLRGLEALNRFVEAATYRGSVLNEMGAAPFYWQQCAQIVRAVPVFRLRRPRDWARLPDALRPVLEYWKP